MRVMTKTAVAVGAVLALGMATMSAMAAPPAGGQKKGEEPLAEKSVLLGTPFPNKPYVLNDDGTYQTLMTAIAKESKKKCQKVESFGWEYKNDSKAQQNLQAIVDATMDAVQNSGYKATQLTPEVTQGRNVVSIAVEKDKKSAIVSWIPLGDAVAFLVCETAPLK